MEENRLKAAVEGILFTMGDAVECDALAQALEATPEEIDGVVDALIADVKSAVISTYHEELGISKNEWQKLIKESDVRVQWDPEKDVNGNNLSYRSLQLGLRGQALYEYVNDWIVGLTDITDYVKELNTYRLEQKDITDLLPKEKAYLI